MSRALNLRLLRSRERKAKVISEKLKKAQKYVGLLSMELSLYGRRPDRIYEEYLRDEEEVRKELEHAKRIRDTLKNELRINRGKL